MNAFLKLGLFALLFFGVFPVSCNYGSCPTPIPYRLDVEELRLSLFNYIARHDSGYLILADESLTFSVNFDGERILAGAYPSLNNYGFGQSLLASKDCPPDYILSLYDTLSHF